MAAVQHAGGSNFTTSSGHWTAILKTSSTAPSNWKSDQSSQLFLLCAKRY